MEARDNFTEQFKKAARRQEDTSAAFPSMEHIWNKVAVQLDAAQQPEQKRRLIPFWKKGIAAAVLLLAGLSLVYLFTRSNTEKGDPAYAGKEKAHRPVTVPVPGHIRSKETQAPLPIAKEQLREATAHRERRSLPVQSRKEQPALRERGAAADKVIADAVTSKKLYDDQPRTITGQVLDEHGAGIAGSSVVVKGTTIGTVTDVNGNYELEVPVGAERLVIKGLGSKDREIDLAAVQGPLVARLEAADRGELSEVQVYGQKIDKKSYAGSVATMSASDIAKTPVSSMSKALAGLQVTSGGGQPGASPDIQIRGQRFLSASEAPLIVVDGKPYSSSLMSIDPNSVSSMTVLKDANATAIYGTRGANGVILITTKKNAQHRSFLGRTWHKVKRLFKDK